MAKTLEAKTTKEARDFVVALPLSGVEARGYYSMEKTGITRAYSERQAVSYLISRQKKDTGLVMRQLDLHFGGAEKYAVEVPDFVEDDFPITLNQLQILREIHISCFLSSVRGGTPQAYFAQAGKILRKGSG